MIKPLYLSVLILNRTYPSTNISLLFPSPSYGPILNQDCCPDKELCEAGINDSCPYTSCRRGVIELLLDFIS